jgi:hypothetical protein
MGSLLTRGSFDMGEYHSWTENLEGCETLRHRLGNAQSCLLSTFGLIYSEVEFCSMVIYTIQKLLHPEQHLSIVWLLNLYLLP